MRIAILSNPNFTTTVGYGTLTKQLCRRLKEFHDLCIIANYGLHGGVIKHEGVPIYPAGLAGFNESLILQHAQHFKADVILSIYDMYALNLFPQQMIYEKKIKWLAYSPLDTDEPNEKYINDLKGAYHIIPMSKHAEQFDKYYPKTTIEEIPVGVDTKIYKPMQDIPSIKKNLGFEEDCFLVLFAGDSRWYRKNVAENLEGFKIFAEENPDAKARIYIHSIVHAQDGSSYDIQNLIRKMGLDDVARCTEPYSFEIGGLSDEDMSKIYNAADCFIHCSAGEGAGMMPLEANACGTPAIYSEFSSQPEYSKGVTVYPTLERYTFSNTKQVIPHPDAIAMALKEVWQKGKAYYSEECMKNAKQYDWDIIINDYWLPYLKVVEDELSKDCVEPRKKLEKSEVVTYE
jgi:glycosyltransferase involved in cell wall biosynthesis